MSTKSEQWAQQELNRLLDEAEPLIRRSFDKIKPHVEGEQTCALLIASDTETTKWSVPQMEWCDSTGRYAALICGTTMFQAFRQAAGSKTDEAQEQWAQFVAYSNDYPDCIPFVGVLLHVTNEGLHNLALMRLVER